MHISIIHLDPHPSRSSTSPRPKLNLQWPRPHCIPIIPILPGSPGPHATSPPGAHPRLHPVGRAARPPPRRHGRRRSPPAPAAQHRRKGRGLCRGIPTSPPTPPHHTHTHTTTSLPQYNPNLALQTLGIGIMMELKRCSTMSSLPTSHLFGCALHHSAAAQTAPPASLPWPPSPHAGPESSAPHSQSACIGHIAELKR